MVAEALHASYPHVGDVHEAGIIVSHGSESTLRDLVVTDVHERACSGAGVSGCDGAGIGFAAYLGGVGRLERFRVSRAALAGLQIARDGALDLVDGEVSDNPVGVNVQVEGYDLTRLTTRVRYRDDGVNLDATSLAIPAATTPGVLGM